MRGKRWTPDDDKQLRSLVIAGYSAAEIAAKLNRTISAINRRACGLRISLKRVPCRTGKRGPK